MRYTYKTDKDHFGTNVTYYLDIQVCNHCGKGNIVRDMKTVHNTGYGSHNDHVTLKWITGGLKDGLLVCDACATISKRLSDVKKLERRRATILRELDKLSITINKDLEELRIDKAKNEGRIDELKKQTRGHLLG